MEEVNTVAVVSPGAPSPKGSGIVFLYHDYEQCLLVAEKLDKSLEISYCYNMQEAMEVIWAGGNTDVVLADERNGGWDLLVQLRQSTHFKNIPFIILAAELTPDSVRRARELKANDIFQVDISKGDLGLRVNFLAGQKRRLAGSVARKLGHLHFKTPFWKRALDLIVVGTAMIGLIPVYLLVGIVIRVDSRGPVFYKSRRVGSGYRIFDLYKFRTMRVDADKLIKDMSAFNTYSKKNGDSDNNDQASLCADCKALGLSQCEQMLFLDGRQICERVYHRQKENEVAFMKFQNDPRITRVGTFLRNTSLDELPQFINIIKGDMSLVGNRPLPLYEAEKLTTDDKIIRFAGPAGLTGLWQVTKRGKSDMSEEERIRLDVEYARNFSFRMDLRIILKTFPALFQSENV
ncbi:sugar transferase [Ravibacter arvi]|uniref:Sugar transferase n=1 Tax=Ravibacter arvi TaxID=2051041 RepID=A0ABP8M3A5_9BACT